MASYLQGIEQGGHGDVKNLQDNFGEDAAVISKNKNPYSITLYYRIQQHEYQFRES